jgi:hypothetical protein
MGQVIAVRTDYTAGAVPRSTARRTAVRSSSYSTFGMCTTASGP